MSAEENRKATEAVLKVVSSALLNRWLAQCAIAPLEPQVRGFMEAKFNAGFGDVRIRTGAAATFLCRALRARALTLGSDIVFADGEYAPASPGGRWLLAHELVHVLQQRAARGRAASPVAPSTFAAVGDEHDACEREADRLASEALDGGLRSRVTPDSSGAIRRAVSVLEATAEMTASHKGATPGISYIRRGSVPLATLHLSRNSGPIIQNKIKITRAAKASAIRITGTVTVEAGPKDTEDDVRDSWSFRFIQLFYVISSKASYAGQTPADGHMSLNFAGPANFRGYGKFLIDSDPDDPNRMPYADNERTLERLKPGSPLWRATVIMDDHPFSDVPLRIGNTAVGYADNYLYAVSHQFQVVTTLVAIDKKRDIVQPLVHLDWGALCTAQLPWHINQAGDPEVVAPRIISSYFLVGEATKGAPAGRGLADMIQNAYTTEPRDTVNAAMKDAFAGVLLTAVNNVDYDARATWPSYVPRDHFKR